MAEFFKKIETVLNDLTTVANDALYGYILIILLILGGLYFTLRTKGGQIRLLGEQFRAVTERR